MVPVSLNFEQILSFIVIILMLNSSRPDPVQSEKINLDFYFQFLCGPSKGFMKALKAFTKCLDAPQRSVKKDLSEFLS